MAFKEDLELSRRLCATDPHNIPEVARAAEDSIEMLGSYTPDYLSRIAFGASSGEVTAAATVSAVIVQQLIRARQLTNRPGYDAVDDLVTESVRRGAALGVHTVLLVAERTQSN